MHGSRPDNKHPVAGFPQICFIKNTVHNPHIIIGDYIYYDNPEGAESFEKNVLYHFPFIGDKLIFGKFCAIGRGAKFIMNRANHKRSSSSTYPSNIFGNGWKDVTPQNDELPYKGDNAIGNYAWTGYNALIMQGVRTDNAAIIASRSVVTHNVPVYAIVCGNHTTTIKMRFSQDDIASLEQVA